MPVLICAIDAGVIFGEDTYYLKFHGIRAKNTHPVSIKYVNNFPKRQHDDLLLKMNQGMDSEQALSLVYELLSTCSFSWNAKFEVEYFTINNSLNFNADLRKVSCSCRPATGRSFLPSETVQDFRKVFPLKSEAECDLCNLFRMSQIAKPIHAQLLYLWHCATYPEVDEKKIEEKINNYCAEYECSTAHKIMQDPLLLKEPKRLSKGFGFGSYAKNCVRHSIAHIRRYEDATGRDIKIDSLNDINHLNLVKKALHEYVRYKLENEYKIKREIDLNYLDINH